MRDIITKHYHTIFEADLLEEIIKIGEIKTYPKDTLLMDFGEYMRHMPLICLLYTSPSPRDRG